MNCARGRHIRSVAVLSDLRTIAVLLVGVLGACGKADGTATDAAQPDLPGQDVEGCNLVEHVVHELPGSTRCTFPLPPPMHPAHNRWSITVWLDGFKLNRNQARMDGWDYMNRRTSQSRPLRPLCEGIVDGTYQTVTVIFDCWGSRDPCFDVAPIRRTIGPPRIGWRK